MPLKRCIKLTPNGVIWCYQETLDLQEDGIKADLKVEFHSFHVTRWISCNTDMTRCISLTKKLLFIPLCPSLPVFPSILEKVSVSLPQNSEFHSLPPLLRLCCVNSFLWFFFFFFCIINCCLSSPFVSLQTCLHPSATEKSFPKA